MRGAHAITAILLLVVSCAPEAPVPPQPAEIARITVGKGVPGVWVTDMNGDGMNELVLADPSAGSYPGYEGGAVYLLTDPARSRDLSKDSADLVLRGQTAFRRFGTSLASVDMDGDGWPDLAIGSDDGQDVSSRVVLVSGLLRGEQPLEPSAFLTLDGPSTLGQAMTGLDYNGDGAEDLVVSCPVRSEVYVVLGPRSGHIVLPEDADAVIAAGTGSLGWTMGTGHFGPDGAMRLVLSEPVREAVYIVPPGHMGRCDLADIVTATIVSSDAGDNIIGCEVTRGSVAAGDRLIVRTRRTDSERIGTVFVLDGPIAGELDLRQDAPLSFAPVQIGYTMSPALGAPPTAAGPVLAMGFPAQSQIPDSGLTGQVWIVPADLSGAHDLNSAGGGVLWSLRAQDVGMSFFGNVVRFADFTGPDAANLVVAGSGAVVIYGW
jgi:hypothetical protein